MLTWFSEFSIVFAMVFVGEIGDKTMLVTLALVAGHPGRIGEVLRGVIPACFTVSIIGVVISVFGKYWLPEYWLQMMTGMLLLCLAYWSFREATEEIGDEPLRVKWWHRYGLVSLSFWTFFIAEMWDRTQFITITVTGRSHQLSPLVADWLGSSLGLASSNLCAVWIFHRYGRLLPRQKLTYGAGILFLASGLWVVLFAQGWNTIDQIVALSICILGLNPWMYRLLVRQLGFSSRAK